MPVGELWVGHLKTDDPVLTACSGRPVNGRACTRGAARRPRPIDGVDLTVLWPAGNAWSPEDNENCVAMRVQSGAWRTAILGDLPDPAEALIGVGSLNVLKVAHHGSRFTSGAELLRQTAPTDAVISVGRNTYGHPHPDVLGRLAAAGIRVWRTDQSGTIRWPIP